MKPTKEQLDKCVKDHPDEGIVATLIVRKISIMFTKYIARTSITPNQISIFSFILGIIGSYFISSGEWNYLIIGGALIPFSYIMDSVDGEIARLKNWGSKKGGFLDSMLDRVKEGIIFLALSIALYKQTGNALAWTLGFIALFSVMMTNTVLQAAGKLDRKVLRSTHESLPIIKKLKAMGIKQSFFSLGVDFHLFFIGVGVALNQIEMVLWFFVIIQNIYWFIIFIMVFLKNE